jgi:hypothetical protein
LNLRIYGAVEPEDRYAEVEPKIDPERLNLRIYGAVEPKDRSGEVDGKSPLPV